MRYSLSSLRVLATVAETGSLVDAGQKLGRTPSTVSMSLKGLEDQIGLPLFEGERKNRLSKAGRFVLAQARDLLAHHERAAATIEAYARNRAGRVELACVPSVATAILPDVLGRFREREPAVEIVVRDADSRSVVEAVETGKVDFGVAGRSFEAQGVAFRPLFAERLGIVCRDDDPLASAAPPLPWAAIAGRPFLGNGIAWRPGHDAPEPGDAAPVVVYNVLSLLALVRARAGVTVLPRLSLATIGSGVVFVPLEGDARRVVGTVTRAGANLSPAVASFMVCLETRIAECALEFGLVAVGDPALGRASSAIPAHR